MYYFWFAFSQTDHAEGSLYGDYQAYLHDARSKIMACSAATESWVYTYDGDNPPHTGNSNFNLVQYFCHNFLVYQYVIML